MHCQTATYLLTCLRASMLSRPFSTMSKDLM
jgi:hypothetical protein